jgi:uncharacterized protein (DUF433 family)
MDRLLDEQRYGPAFYAAQCGCPARYYQCMSWPDRIVVDPEVLAGKPVIRGTRLAVEFILDLLAAGQSETDIVANYPGLAHEDVLACLAYASHLAHEYKAYPLPV